MKTVIEMAREAADPDKVNPFRNGFWVLTQEELEKFAELVRADAIAKEREACAKLCDELHPGLSTKRVAEIIRARGETSIRGKT